MARHCAPGRKVSPEDRQGAFRPEGVVEGPYHVGVGHPHTGQVLFHCFARHGHAVPCQELLDPLHHDRHTSCFVEIVEHVGSRRGHADQGRHRPADVIPHVECQRDARLVCVALEVDKGVGAPADGHVDGYRVLQALHGEDVPRLKFFFAISTILLPVSFDSHIFSAETRSGGARAGQREAKGLHEQGHGVARRHLAAGAGRAAAAIGYLFQQLLVGLLQVGGILQLAQLPDDDLLPLHVADVPALVRRGDHLSAADEYEGPVQADGGEHHPGNDLVAGPDPYPAVAPADPKGGFD